MGRSELIQNELQAQSERLAESLATVDTFVDKKYLTYADTYSVLPMVDGKEHTCVRIFRLEKLVLDGEEPINEKLINVYAVLHSVCSECFLLIEGTDDTVGFYLGVRAEGKDIATASDALKKTFLGNFAGSNLLPEEAITLLGRATGHNVGVAYKKKNIVTVSLVPSERESRSEAFLQGLERFIDAMRGVSYTAMILAKPLDKVGVECRKKGLEEAYSSMSPLEKVSFSYGVNSSTAVTNGTYENLSKSLNNSISNAMGTNAGQNNSRTRGENTGNSYNAGGFGYSRGQSTGETQGYTSGISWTRSVSSAVTDTTSEGSNRSMTETRGDSRNMTVEHKNKSVGEILERIDGQLDRLSQCDAYGAWDVVAYFMSEDVDAAIVAANTYKALTIGDKTATENSYINSWFPLISREREKTVDKMVEYLFYAKHPVFCIPFLGGSYQEIPLTSVISGKELPLLMGLPQKSVTGVSVVEDVAFGRNPPACTEDSIRLGSVCHMGNREGGAVSLDRNSLTGHLFVTGSTGSGKSNAIYCILSEMVKEKIPFLVVEPAKGEYKDFFASVPNLHVFTANPYVGMLLKLNPFRFNKNIHVLEHLDRLIEIFSACWEMYAAMPAILKEAMERVYAEAGWDLLNSVYVGDGFSKFPTFCDLLRVLPELIHSSEYSKDVQSDYTGALLTRIASLTNGIIGQIFCDCYDIPDVVLFDEYTIIDLSRVGSLETKSLIMGILMLKLTEYRMACTEGRNLPLRHLTVLEEAHHLLKRIRNTASEVVAKSVEMICNSIAEMRTYGEGFIIADQSPSSVDDAAIKNTNTKIVMRLPDKEDCEIAGAAISLTPRQVAEISKLETGVALVMQNNWQETIRCVVDLCSNEYSGEISAAAFFELKVLRTTAIGSLMQDASLRRAYDVEKAIRAIDKTEAPELKKKELAQCLRTVQPYLFEPNGEELMEDLLLSISGTAFLFKSAETMLSSVTSETVAAWKRRILEKMNVYINVANLNLEQLLKSIVGALARGNVSVDYRKVRRILEESNG